MNKKFKTLLAIWIGALYTDTHCPLLQGSKQAFGGVGIAVRKNKFKVAC